MLCFCFDAITVNLNGWCSVSFFYLLAAFEGFFAERGMKGKNWNAVVYVNWSLQCSQIWKVILKAGAKSTNSVHLESFGISQKKLSWYTSFESFSFEKDLMGRDTDMQSWTWEIFEKGRKIYFQNQCIIDSYFKLCITKVVLHESMTEELRDKLQLCIQEKQLMALAPITKIQTSVQGSKSVQFSLKVQKPHAITGDWQVKKREKFIISNV